MDKSESQFSPNQLSELRESIVDKVTRDTYAQIKADDKGIEIGVKSPPIVWFKEDAVKFREEFIQNGCFVWLDSGLVFAVQEWTKLIPQKNPPVRFMGEWQKEALKHVFPHTPIMDSWNKIKNMKPDMRDALFKYIADGPSKQEKDSNN